MLGTALSAALVLAVALCCAWLAAPGGFAQRVPGDDALGTPATGTFKATHAYDVVDEEATEELRAAAAAAERPVYDLDETAAEDAAARVHAAFEVLRDGGEGSAARRAARRREERSAPHEAPLSRRALFGSRLGVEVDERSFEALAATRFSEPVEGLLVGLASRALGGRVVDDRRRLDEARERGVVVRAARGSAARREYVLADLRLVSELDEARADVQRAAAALPVAPALAAALGAVARGLARPTLAPAAAETTLRQRRAAEEVAPVVLHIRRGEKIVGDGEVIEARHLAIFRAIRARDRRADLPLIRLGAALLVGALVLLLWTGARRAAPSFRPARKDALLLAGALLATAALAAGGLAVGEAVHDRFPRFGPETLFQLLPFAAGAMVVRTVLPASLALLFSVGAGGVAGLVAGSSLAVGLQVTATSLLAAILVPRARDRAGLLRVGAAVGALGALCVTALGLFAGRSPSDLLAPALAALLGGCVLLPVTTSGSLPLVEWLFAYLTEAKLLELANLNHPALRELVVSAPGTYHHAVIMGSLVEAAAQKIGANALLARVCAYYHDIGKTRNPGFFGENGRGSNPHEELAPAMSALIVKRHVTDGIELARAWRLPAAVAAVIPEHHGTRLVGAFWARAQQRAGADAASLHESTFRYPGPKPQSRETALVMIADACEASARTLPQPTGEALRSLVGKRINEIFSEGQLDECDLTLRDLNGIAAAIVRALEGIYHARPVHPKGPGSHAASGPPGGEASPALQLAVRGPPAGSVRP